MIEPRPVDPREFLREFRRSFVNLYLLWTRVEREVPRGVELHTPAQRAITDDQLPPDLRAVVSDYRARHGGASLTWMKYLRSVDGRPAEVIEDERPLPEDARFITVSHTSTLAAGDELLVTTELFVGEFESGPQPRVRSRG